MTAALEGGEWSAACPSHTLPPGKTRYPLYRRLGGRQGRSGRVENLAPPGFDPQTVQPVVSRYTDWATQPTPSSSVYYCSAPLFLYTSTFLAVATAPIGFLQPSLLLSCSPLQDHKAPLIVQILSPKSYATEWFFSCMDHVSTLKMDAVILPKMLVHITQYGITS